MSDVLHWDCERAQSLLTQHVDGDLGPGESAWLAGHLAQCGECGAALARLAALDSQLTGWGRQLSRVNPPPSDARERLAAAVRARSAGRRSMRWVRAAATAIAAGLALLAIVPRSQPPVETQDASGFVEIPYLAPLDPHESATVMRIQIRVATLIAVGYRVAADPDEIVPADVLVGEDGRAHAVRVSADIGLNGIGD
jgi:anti-sigma factor RsiW